MDFKKRPLLRGSFGREGLVVQISRGYVCLRRVPLPSVNATLCLAHLAYRAIWASLASLAQRSGNPATCCWLPFKPTRKRTFCIQQTKPNQTNQTNPQPNQPKRTSPLNQTNPRRPPILPLRSRSSQLPQKPAQIHSSGLVAKIFWYNFSASFHSPQEKRGPQAQRLGHWIGPQKQPTGLGRNLETHEMVGVSRKSMGSGHLSCGYELSWTSDGHHAAGDSRPFRGLAKKSTTCCAPPKKV